MHAEDYLVDKVTEISDSLENEQCCNEIIIYARVYVIIISGRSEENNYRQLPPLR